MELKHVARVCPMLEAEHPGKPLSYAPAPWKLVQCEQTGFVYLQNPPRYEHLAEDFAWEATYAKESDSRQQAEPTRYAISQRIKQFRRSAMKRDKVMRLATQFLLQRASSHDNALAVLDVGCADGNLLERLIPTLPSETAKRVKPYGIEISNQLAASAGERLRKLGGDCIHASAVDGLAGCAENMFDLIVLSSFLEHEINPLPLLRSCYDSLKPGGFVIIKVPNYSSLNRHLRGARWCGFRWPDHVNYFTPASLSAMAQKSGLTLARMTLADRQPLSDSMYCVLTRDAD